MGDDGAAIRRSLESDTMKRVRSISSARWFAAGDAAAAFFTLGVRAGDRDIELRVAERFRVVAGELVEIEAVVAPVAGD